jgi:NADPH-dependent 2,4-dienoyl-CoA reductase/sulfur reductase-like enzyme
MNNHDVVIIGGSAAGFAAAITARRQYPDARIAVVRQEHKTMVPCGIPYIFGTLGASDMDLMPDPALDKNAIELIIGKVVRIDRSVKIITTSTEQVIGYKKLIMATGSLPLIPHIPGAELTNVFSIQKDASYLDHMLAELKHARNVVIIGGGFIGLEMADECRKLGHLNITVIEMLSHCLFAVFDEDACMAIENELTEAGVSIQDTQRAKAITGDGKVEFVELESGERLPADIVIMGIGVHPNTTLAQEAGLDIGPSGAVAVDRHMVTSDPDIFAVGDCAEKQSFFTGKPVKTWLASVATAEARIAAANLFEIRRTNKGAISVFSTKIGKHTTGLAGIRERDAEEAGIAHVTGISSAPDRHPPSIPGATMLEVKLVFRKYTGILIGGQVSGGDSAGELINLVAAMIQAEMNADQIATFQMGTHPLLTASPVPYQVVNAAEIALSKLRQGCLG